MTASEPPAPETFADDCQRLNAQLARLDLLLRREVERFRRRRPQGEPFDALYISDAEIDALIDPRRARADGAPSEVELRLTAALEQMSACIADRVADARARGREPRFDRLARLCRLSRLEQDVLLIALAAEITPRYRRLYAYLQDDATLLRPCLDFAVDLAGATGDARLEARRIVAPQAPLRRNRLLALTGEPAALALQPEAGVLDYLIGLDALDPRVAAFARLHGPHGSIDALPLPEPTRRRLDALVRSGAPPGGIVLHLQGRYGSGRRETAEAVASGLGSALLVVDSAAVAGMTEAETRATVALIDREALMRGAAVYWDGFDAFLDDARRPQLRALSSSWSSGVAFLAGERAFEPRGEEAAFAGLALASPSTLERVELWRRALSGPPADGDEDDLLTLANGFRLTGGEIRDAVASASDAARWRGVETVGLADLQAACRRLSSQGLAALGQKIEPRFGWRDLVLPVDRMRQLQEIADAIKYRTRVLDEWGFAAKLSLGKGLAVLFAGASGTGKTMAAEAIAGELALDLYKIDLSAVVSKFIGETEKNLSRIFTEAETSNAILFFDEADALFGKRSEVRDAHDRYANIETAYLLQRLESYEGLVILATNLKKNMDEAFVRRLQSVIEFPMPGEAERRRLWASIWPPSTPLAKDVDWEALARFELAGGAIKNIALAAAFLAAAEGGEVAMTHLLRAAQREFQKMGRIRSPGELVVGGSATGRPMG